MFRLVDRPALMPARTLIGSTVGPVVDTEATLLNGGRVYVSEIEAGEIVKFFPAVVERLAADFGWLAPHQAAALKERIETLEAELVEARSGQPRVIAFEDAEKLFKRPKAAA